MVSGGHGKGSLADRKTAQNEFFRETGLYSGFKTEILDEFIRVLKKINIYIWCSKNQIYQIINYFFNVNKKLNFDIITWHKTNPPPLANMTYLNDTEYCINFREVGVTIKGEIEQRKKYYITSLNKKDKDKFSHPTCKPVEIIRNLIINSTDEGDIILDTFVGSGTTCVACKETKRHYLAFDIDNRWCKVAENRLNNQDDTGQFSMFTF